MKPVYIAAALDDLERARACLILAKAYDADWHRHWWLVDDARADAQRVVNSCERELASITPLKAAP